MGAERTRATEPTTERPTENAPATPARPAPAPILLGAANDRFERDADETARRVTESLHGGVSLGPDGSPFPHSLPTVPRRIQRRSDSRDAVGGELDDATTQRIRRARSGGTPLAGPVRRRMETAFGTELPQVRMHHGAEAARLNDRVDASAFTIGSDVFFRDGLPDTSTPDGTELLAHELTHTLQQAGRVSGHSSMDEDHIGRVQRRNRGKNKKRGRRPANKKPSRQQSKQRSRPRPPAPVVAPSASSALTRFAPLVDLAVPAPGDSGGLEFAAKVPLDATGSTFLQFDFSGDAERDRENVELGLEVAVGYGGSATLPFGLTPEIVGKLGGSVSAKATNSSEALTLISYAFYRYFRESGAIPREAADFLWGQGGSTGATSGEESEQWGADVEQQIFAANPDAEVSLGASLGLDAELELDDESGDGLEVGVAIASATKYSKETLEQSGKGGTSQLGKVGKERDTAAWTPWLASLAGMQRGAQNSVGEVERTLAISLGVSSSGLTGEADLELALQRELEFTFELAGSGELGAAQRRPAQIAEMIVPWVASARRLVDVIRSKETSLAQYAGALGEAADTIGEVIDGYSARKDELATLLEGKIGGSGTRSVKIGVTIQREDGEISNELTISYVSAYEAKGKPRGFGAEASVERERKLVSVEWP